MTRGVAPGDLDEGGAVAGLSPGDSPAAAVTWTVPRMGQESTSPCATIRSSEACRGRGRPAGAL
ncbi:hypothetical protein [Actinomyces marmotae]|uniref:hypothetical protein n=2 Tax=Actinomyces TaxID=1654 RepID=UPI00135A8019|nr:hypothetical protein [Actinomyces marmotae]